MRLIVEADGGSRGNPGPAAYGALLREADTGRLIAEKAEAIGTATNNVAEYRGLIAGLLLLHDHAPDARDVEVRMDSRLVIEQMAGRWKVKHPDIRRLVVEARRLAPAGVTWTWVPRADNSRADRLVNSVLDEAAGPALRPVTGPAPGATPNSLVGWAPDLGRPTRVVLLRHGQTDRTLGKRFNGSGGVDTSLDPAGRAQAAAAAAWVGSCGVVDAVRSSPLARARETATVVAEALGLSAEVDEGLRETAFGAWDGHTFAEVQERWPAELQAWLASTSAAPPGGESFEQVAVRVRRARDRIVREHPGRTVVAVTHVTPIKLLVCATLQAPLSALFRMDVPPGSVTVVDWYADGISSLRSFSVQPGG
jgi:probable phosphoglycerate mutase